MQNFFLISGDLIPMEWIVSCMAEIGNVRISPANPNSAGFPEIYSEVGNSWVMLTQDPSLTADFLHFPDASSFISSCFSNPHFILGQFNDVELVNKLFAALSARNDLLIDNDHGLTAPIADFVKWCREGKDWRNL